MSTTMPSAAGITISPGALREEKTAASERVFVVWNPREENDVTNAVRAALAERRGVVLATSRSAEEAENLVDEALNDGTQIIVAAGGDGTVNLVVNVMLDRSDSAQLAIIPLGTGNDTCRTLAIPLDPLEAVSLLDHGRSIYIDAIQVRAGSEIRHYVNMASAGFSSQVVETLPADVKRRWGRFSYIRAAASAVFEKAGYDIEFSLDGAPAERMKVMNVVLGNGRTSSGGLAVAPAADPQDGLLEVILVREGSLMDLAALIPSLLAGELHQNEAVIYRRAKEVRIDSRPKLSFSADGDLIADTPATFIVRPRALSVLVGPNYQPPNYDGIR